MSADFAWLRGRFTQFCFRCKAIRYTVGERKYLDNGNIQIHVRCDQCGTTLNVVDQVSGLSTNPGALRG